MAGLGLTEAQTEAVKATWAVVNGDLKTHGVAVFATLFRAYPDTQKLFRRLKNIPAADLEKAATLRAHALGFMKELSGMMENLDNAEELVIMIEGNARRHNKRTVTVTHYEIVFELFLGCLKTTLGDKFTQEAEDGWKLVTKAIRDTVAKEYSAIEEETE